MFGIKLFFVNILLSFLENIEIIFHSFEDIFRKCVEMENNQLNCDDYFHFISDACDGQQINYRWPNCMIKWNASFKKRCSIATFHTLMKTIRGEIINF